MLKKLSSTFLILSLFLFTLPTFAKAEVDNKVITLATTTSTENSGLLKTILPRFEEITGYKVRTIAVGTGKALRMGRDGDVDVLLVHAKKAEDKFMADGDGEKRLDVMYNDFVIIGPKDDPAKVSNSKNIKKALKKISSTKNIFISRGDNSGTHKKELYLWKSASIDTKNHDAKWYREAGQGMGKVLQMAGEMDAYTLTDRGTWLAYESKSSLKIVYEGDTVLFNPYGIIAVSSKKYPDLNTEGAYMLMDWIVSRETQLSIGQFKIAGKVLFTPNAASHAEESSEQAK
jgi:tungstate transport system substrate-binding protein